MSGKQHESNQLIIIIAIYIMTIISDRGRPSSVCESIFTPDGENYTLLIL